MLSYTCAYNPQLSQTKIKGRVFGRVTPASVMFDRSKAYTEIFWNWHFTCLLQTKTRNFTVLSQIIAIVHIYPTVILKLVRIFFFIATLYCSMRDTPAVCTKHSAVDRQSCMWSSAVMYGRYISGVITHYFFQVKTCKAYPPGSTRFSPTTMLPPWYE